MTAMHLEQVEKAVDLYVATTTASDSFEDLGFAIVDQSDAPELVLPARQLSGICLASATVMKLTRPPT
ncbi:N-acetylglutamate synthase-like GNAT family acetyltransferase [Rhizobium skierniewicense]|uniref:N-acetylglutamate synthase-like GNAT family acetyltransferase n=1 Tax=Rhizobium skierniewicense TaxID=984260 RepID=A0A7W6CBT7_9HYPH|nr:hypothetical protein [Rhizobium skierniewicense]MBB3948219.1 N-acetylglutamate synthase-like GNAT family acetyltransferase [Rhizobium skierniewicense]